MMIEPWTPAALESADPTPDETFPRDFAEVADAGEKTLSFACHELIHGGHGCAASHHSALV